MSCSPQREKELRSKAMKAQRVEGAAEGKVKRTTDKLNKRKAENAAAKKAGKPNPWTNVQLKGSRAEVTAAAKAEIDAARNRRKAEDALADCRQIQEIESRLNPAQRDAQFLLSSKNTRCDNYRSPYDGKTAGDCLREFVQRGKVYCKQAGKDVKLNATLLSDLRWLSQFGVLPLNCLTNGEHSGAGSTWPSGTHPQGKGGDIGKNGLTVPRSRIFELQSRSNAYVLDEDAGHFHISER